MLAEYLNFVSLPRTLWVCLAGSGCLIQSQWEYSCWFSGWQEYFHPWYLCGEHSSDEGFSQLKESEIKGFSMTYFQWKLSRPVWKISVQWPHPENLSPWWSQINLYKRKVCWGWGRSCQVSRRSRAVAQHCWCHETVSSDISHVEHWNRKRNTRVWLWHVARVWWPPFCYLTDELPRTRCQNHLWNKEIRQLCRQEAIVFITM